MSGEANGAPAQQSPTTGDGDNSMGTAHDSIHTSADSPSGDGGKGTAQDDKQKKATWWHKHEVFAAVEACLSAQEAAGESTVSTRAVMANDRYLPIAMRMQTNGEWEFSRTPL